MKILTLLVALGCLAITGCGERAAEFNPGQGTINDTLPGDPGEGGASSAGGYPGGGFRGGGDPRAGRDMNRPQRPQLEE